MEKVNYYKPGQLITIPNFGVVRVTRIPDNAGCAVCPFYFLGEYANKAVCCMYCVCGRKLPDDCYLKPEIVWKEKNRTNQER